MKHLFVIYLGQGEYFSAREDIFRSDRSAKVSHDIFGLG